MEIKQEKTFKPLTITLESKEEHDSFVQIIDEANSTPKHNRSFMEYNAVKMVIELSEYFSNNE